MSLDKSLAHLETEGEALGAEVSPARDAVVAVGSFHGTSRRSEDQRI